MKTLWLTVCILGLLLGAAARAEDVVDAEVREAFDRYRSAVLAHEGEAAAGMLSSDSLRFFALLQQLALRGSASELRREPLIHQLHVLTFRHRLHPDRLREMAPRELFVHAIRRGWLGAEEVVGLSAGDLRLVEGTAELEVLRDGRVTSLRYHWVREDGAWHWDMRPTLRSNDRVIRMRARRKGVPGEEYVRTVIGSGSGREVPDSIWEPPFPDPGATAAR